MNATIDLQSLRSDFERYGLRFIKTQWEWATAQTVGVVASGNIANPLENLSEHATPLALTTLVRYLERTEQPYRIYRAITFEQIQQFSQPHWIIGTKGQLLNAKSIPTDQKNSAKFDVVALVAQPSVIQKPTETLNQLKKFWTELRSCDWLVQAVKSGIGDFRVIIQASLLINILALAAPLFSIQIYDRIIPNQAFASMVGLMIGLGIAIAIEHALKDARHRLMDHATTLSDIHCTRLLSATLLKSPANHTDAGTLLQLIRSMDHLREIITGMFLLAVIDLPFATLYLLVIALIHPLLIIPALVLLTFCVLSGMSSQETLALHSANQINHQKKVHERWLDTLINLSAIKSNGATPAAELALNNAQLDNRLSGNSIRHILFHSQQRAALSAQVAWIAVLAIGVYLITEQQLTVGGLIASAMLSMRCFSSLSKLDSQLSYIHTAQAGFKELDQFFKKNNSPVGKQSIERIEHIQIRDVNVQTPNPQQLLLKGIELNVKRGERIGIIGPTGAGKSTLLQLIAGQFQIAQGSYLVNHLQLSEIDPQAFASRLGFATQPPQIIQDSLIENIRMRRPWISESACVAIAQQFGLTQWAQHRGEGLGLHIQSGGTNLSSGQKQLLCLARAFAGEPDLILLDEPTVCLDQHAEERLYASLRNLKPDQTLIFTTHKLNMLEHCDRLILVHNSRIIADGTKQTVLTEAAKLNQLIQQEQA